MIQIAFRYINIRSRERESSFKELTNLEIVFNVVGFDQSHNVTCLHCALATYIWLNSIQSWWSFPNFSVQEVIRIFHRWSQTNINVIKQSFEYTEWKYFRLALVQSSSPHTVNSNGKGYKYSSYICLGIWATRKMERRRRCTICKSCEEKNTQIIIYEVIIFTKFLYIPIKMKVFIMKMAILTFFSALYHSNLFLFLFTK